MTFEELGIVIPHAVNGPNVRTTCPKCSNGRKKKRDKCLSVNVQEGVWLCHHCQWSGSLNSADPRRVERLAREQNQSRAKLVKLIGEADQAAGLELSETDAEALGRAAQVLETEPPVLLPSDPLSAARELVTRRYQYAGLRTLHYVDGEFYEWRGTHYANISQDAMRAVLWGFLEKAETETPKGELAPYKPNKNRVSDVLDALRAITHQPVEREPCFLGGAQEPVPDEIVACRNGLLHLPTGELLPHTPAFFNRNALTFAHDPESKPAAFLEFLHSLWPDDDASIQTLQEMAGYLLTPDTRQQKLFLLIGPKRAGKGTIARVLTELLGRENVAAPTLGALSQNFGMQPLIGKPAAIISDARLGGRADQHAIAERLLSISGEDVLTIDRKYGQAWTGKLPTRFVILTNETPRLADSSGALASRFVVLQLSRSFYGKEDPNLTGRLTEELPGILSWAIEGWRRLNERGRFDQPASASQAIEELEDLGSPIAAFVRERCILDAMHSTAVSEVFNAWRKWCAANGREHPGTQQSFGRDLRACLPGLRVERPRVDGERVRMYVGLGLAYADHGRSDEEGYAGES